MTRTYETTKGGAWITTVTAVEQEQYDGGSFVFDGSFEEVRASLEAIWAEIPEAYRSNAQCAIGSAGGYEGSHCATIKVTYQRPATPEEIAEVIRRREAQAEQAQRKEQATYAALRAKYGDKA